MSPIDPALQHDADALCRDARFRNLLMRHCRIVEPLAASDRISTRIHPADQMLTHSLEQHRHAGAALSQYFNIGLQQFSAARQVMRSCFSDAEPAAVLDFACGYGRLLRFMSLAVPRPRLWASEIQADAMQFVAQAFDVQVLPSHADPDRFAPAQRFDFIWVASLFSHLPGTLFDAWLEKLMGLLTDRGVLCFSVRDSSLLPAARALPDSGLLYDAVSENHALDAEIYGTTYADERYVRAALARAGAPNGACERLPRALAQEQDLYVVARDPGRDLSGLKGFRRGPWGWVDRRRLSSTGVLEFEGWAASLDDGVAERVEIIVDGVVHHCGTGVHRADVEEAFGDPRLANAGWRVELDLGRASSEAFVEVSAKTLRNESSLLFGGLVRCEDH